MTSEAASRDGTRRTAPLRDLDKRCIDTIRTLAIDAVEKAQSGHAGTPMGLAPVAYTLWQQFLRYDPSDRYGRTAIVSCCPPATLQCCFMRFCILPAYAAWTASASPLIRRSPSTTLRTFASSTA